jgi:pyoverdine/dityrosine biosynthesis protein Dit1
MVRLCEIAISQYRLGEILIQFFSDLVGVPDTDVWNYEQTLKAIAVAKGYKHISFSRIQDLVSIALPEQLNEMTYVANASNFRRALLNTFSRSDWDWKTLSQNEDVSLAYKGYIKVLEIDLQTMYPVGDDSSKLKYKQGIESVAEQMMARGDVSLFLPFRLYLKCRSLLITIT